MLLERVACIEKRRVLDRGLWPLSFELEEWSPYVGFIPRHKGDERGIESPYHLGATWLQIVAYIVPRRPGRVLVMNRKAGSDPRLEGRLTIALGGHVNIEDWARSWSLAGAVREAARREAGEEAPSLVGGLDSPGHAIYIPMTRNPVDRVHVGFIVPAVVESQSPVQLEDGTMEVVGWMGPDDALREFPGRFENWSAAILRSLAGEPQDFEG